MTDPRPLSPAEMKLIERLLRATPERDDDLSAARVVSMDDGGMGSVRFDDEGTRKYGGTLAETVFHDTDGMTVSAALYVDEQGRLFELDIWKHDFSPLRSLPDEL